MRSAATRSCSYQPSELEQEWFDGNRHDRVCATGIAQIDRVEHWLAYSERVAPRPPQSAEQNRVISRFKGCASLATEFIEPLTGWARHPLADVCYPKWQHNFFNNQNWLVFQLHLVKLKNL